MFAPDVEVSGGIQHGGAVESLVEASATASLLVVGSRGLRHTMATAPVRTEMVRAAGQVMTDAIAPWRSAFPDVRVSELVLESSFEAVVSQAALAVVGSRGRGRLSGLLLGSTSQAMLAESDCPVVVVREPEPQN